MQPKRPSIWLHESIENASGKAGAVQALTSNMSSRRLFSTPNEQFGQIRFLILEVASVIRKADQIIFESGSQA
jgi:hypothetical protein